MLMYQAKFYDDLSRDKIAEEVQKEGFDPVYISDPPAFFILRTVILSQNFLFA